MKKKVFTNKFIANLDKFGQEQVSKYIKNLNEENTHLSSLLEGIGFSLFEISLDGKIIYLNRQAQKMILYSIKKVKGKQFASLNIDMSLKIIFNQALVSNIVRNEDIFLSKEKNSRFKVNSFPKVVAGKIESFIFTIQNETESGHKRQKYLQEKSMESLAMLTAGVAHEIKNPLGALDLHVQLIERFIKNKNIKDKQELSDLVQVLSEEIHRLNEIVNSFLFSLRPIKAQKKLENLNDIISEVIKIFRPVAEKDDILVTFDKEKNLKNIPLDKNHIKQSLINIIQNSINAKDKNKKNHFIKLLTFSNKLNTGLIIRDNGVGIDKKDLPNIFNPFFSTNNLGTGLGLTIVYKIIKENGGEITVTSQKNIGSEFKINFRLKANAFLLGK